MRILNGGKSVMGGMALNRVAGWLGLLKFLAGPTTRRGASHVADQPVAPRQALQVMFFSGLAGFFLGLPSNWQIAVESAQALAGVVSYPSDNPFYMYHLKSWTLLHQIPAALLACGMGERALSMLLAGLTGAISFQAIALCAFVLGRDRLLACVLPLACEMTNACRDFESVHQIRLLSEAYWSIYGVLGIGYVLYSWSLLAAGFGRAGALLLGLGPAVHPTLGAWGLLIGAPALAWRWRRERGLFRGEAAALAAGAGITAASLCIQLYLARNLPSADPDLARRLVIEFARNWDNHRVVVSLLHPVVVAVCCTLAICLVWLRFDARLSSDAQLLLGCLACSSSLSLPLAFSTHFQDWLPFSVLMAMPGRFNDLAAVAFPALTIGLLARYRTRLLLQIVLSAAVAYFLFKSLMMTSHRFYISPAPRVLPAAALALLLIGRELTGAADDRRGSAVFWGSVRLLSLAGIGAAALACRVDEQTICVMATIACTLYFLSGTHARWQATEALLHSRMTARYALRLIDFACLAAIATIVVGAWLTTAMAAGGLVLARKEWLSSLSRYGVRTPAFLRAATAALAAASLLLGGGAFRNQFRAASARLDNWQDNPVFAAVARSEGLVLTAGRLALVQLRSRRPVLLYGAALNQITYVPASAPKVNEILQQVYDEDLMKPRPGGWIPCGGLLSDSAKELWLRRSPQEWHELGRRFGVTDVVTAADWDLQLPCVARDGQLAVFRIPGEIAGAGNSSDEAPHSLARLSSRSDSTTAATSLPNVGE